MNLKKKQKIKSKKFPYNQLTVKLVLTCILNCECKCIRPMIEKC